MSSLEDDVVRFGISPRRRLRRYELREGCARRIWIWGQQAMRAFRQSGGRTL